jgi:hypothetical protein
MLLSLLPAEETFLWGGRVLDVSQEDIPETFREFCIDRARELKLQVMSPERNKELAQRLAQSRGESSCKGPCVMGDLCGESHMREMSHMFEEMTQESRLAIIQRRQWCKFCFRHSDSQPCPSHSKPASPIQGCMCMHHKLLHNALLKEEARAIVVEVEPELGELEGEEEFYVASLKDLNLHDGDEGEGEESERETQSPVDSEVKRPRLCQQRVPVEVNRVLHSLHTLCDWGSTVTLVCKESVRRMGLRPLRAAR